MHQIIRWRQSSCRIKSKYTILFHLRKINAAQKWYTTTEIKIELLSTIETCKEYKNIPLGYDDHIIIFTERKNYTFNGMKSLNPVLSWILLLEEYGVTF
jgi:hypothetical protein